MPFTISHAVLAPPISKWSGQRLPISALAIGCMVPDLVRLFTSEEINKTHLWSAWLYPNLIIGIAFCLMWYLIFRPAVFKFIGIQKPLNILTFKEFIIFSFWIALSLIIGTATHLLWDGLTHVDFRTFAFYDFLNQNISLMNRSYPMHRVLQVGTSILALPVLLWMALKHQKRYAQNPPIHPKIKIYALSLLAVSFFAGCFGYISFAQPLGPAAWQNDLYWFIGKSINHSFSAFLMVFALGCIIFQILDRKAYFQ